MAAPEVTTMFGDWVYVAAPIAAVAVAAITNSTSTIGTRAAARWDRWCQTPNPTPIQRRRRPPTPRSTR